MAQTIESIDLTQEITVQLCDASKVLDAQSKNVKNGFMLRRTITERYQAVP
jgi:hypothetical protein